MGNDLANAVRLAADPAKFGWPPTLALEVALKTMPIKGLCEAYGYDRADWDTIRANPAFVAEVQAASESLKKEGMAFKIRAQMQSLDLLKESWRLIHANPAEVPANVKADLIKATWRVAGLEPKAGSGEHATTPPFSINFHMA